MALVTRAHVDVDATADEGFGLDEEHPPFSSRWHAHTKHQILFAAQGTLTLATEERRWTLPPERAAWIHAGTRHMAESKTGVSLRTVYLAPELTSEAPLSACVFAVTPLAREMLLHAMRWGPRAPVAASNATRDAFFRALAGLAAEWVTAERPYYLPAAKTEALARALRWIDGHLVDANVEGAAAAAHLAVRTLARRFEEETGTTFRAYLQAARMMRAMELLSKPGASVTTVAYDVGFKSLGAFTTAFTERCGETPSTYRSRVSGSTVRRPNLRSPPKPR